MTHNEIFKPRTYHTSYDETVPEKKTIKIKEGK